MKDTNIIKEIARKTALELAHRCGIAKADIDMAEVIIRQALRDACTSERDEIRKRFGVDKWLTKTGKKNPNRFYVSE